MAGWMGPARIACSLLLLLSVAFQPAQAASERQLKEQELAQLRQKIKALQGELQKVRSHYDTLRNELRLTEQKISSLTRSLAQLDGKLATTRKRLADLKRRQRRLEGSMALQRDYLAGQIRAAYLMGRQEYLKILLNQQDPATVGRVSTYYDYLNQARSERIGAISHTINELKQVKQQVGVEAERLEVLRQQQLQEKRSLVASRKQRASVVAQLKGEISSKDKQLERMVRNEQQLQALIQALVEALEDIPPDAGNRPAFGKLKGKLLWPAKGALMARYGSEKAGKLRWQGVMIAAPEGHKVKAVSHGRVAFSDWLKGYGLLVIIDHGDGYMSLYGHNQSLYKETGDWVEKDEVIATVGNSGGFDKTALYFEIRQNGRPTNPARWCRRVN